MIKFSKFLFVFFFLISICFTDLLAEEPATMRMFSTSGPKAPVLLSDPEQTVITVRFIKSTGGYFNKSYFMDMAFGSDAPIANYYVSASDKSPAFSINAKGLIRSRFGFNTESFNLTAIDFYGGASLILKPDILSNHLFEAYLYHQSGHLGDDYLVDNDYLKPTNFSHEILRLLHYWKASEELQIVYGPIFVIRKDSSLNEGSFGAQLNLSYSKILLERIFSISGDFKLRKFKAWNYYSNVIASFGLSKEVSNQNYAPAQKLFIEYRTGKSTFGQFVNEAEQMISVGILVNL